MPFRPTLIPTLFTVPALIALLALGVWQLQRLEWKETLIERLHSRAEAPAAPLPTGALPEEEWEYRNVTLRGVFMHANEVHLLNRSLNGNPGLHVLTPMRRTDEGAPEVILINRGWVPFKHKAPEDRVQGQLEGEVTVTGIVRYAKPAGAIQGLFLPENDPAKNMWYRLDHDEAATVIGESLPQHYVMDGRTEIPGLFPVGRQWSLDIRNDHLQYALTWFIFAIALSVIYVVYHLRRERE